MSYENKIKEQEAVFLYQKVKECYNKYNSAKAKLNLVIKELEANPEHANILNSTQEEKDFIDTAKLEAGVE